MPLFRNFDEITDDNERREAIATYDYIVNSEKLTDSIDKAELRTDIVYSYTQQSPMFTDDVYY